MSILYRITYVDRKGFVTNEWHPTMMTGELRVQELDVLGMESIDIEEVDVPWDHLADLIHWLNNNPNSPNIKDGTMSTIYPHPETACGEPVMHGLNPATMKPYPPQRAAAARCESEPIAGSAPAGALAWQDVPKPSALDNQVGGDHYRKHGDYQPWEVLRHWLTPDEFRGFMKGQAIVYLARERDKGGDEDVSKAEHYLRGLLELAPQKE